MEDNCYPCPISIRAKERFCGNTPYYAAYEAFLILIRNGSFSCDQSAFDAEIRYLQETLAMVKSGKLHEGVTAAELKGDDR